MQKQYSTIAQQILKISVNHKNHKNQRSILNFNRCERRERRGKEN
jgi:hypothetical protein